MTESYKEEAAASCHEMHRFLVGVDFQIACDGYFEHKNLDSGSQTTPDAPPPGTSAISALDCSHEFASASIDLTFCEMVEVMMKSGNIVEGLEKLAVAIRCTSDISVNSRQGNQNGGTGRC
jgi:hypothetical protein